MSRHAEKYHWRSSRTQVIVRDESNKSIISFLSSKKPTEEAEEESVAAEEDAVVDEGIESADTAAANRLNAGRYSN